MTRTDRVADWFADVPTQKGSLFGIAGLVVLIFFTANLPWHLDNYDQAKQAYVAFEIKETGNWLLQTTPAGRSASKPPLMGWISAAMHAIGVPWDWAFRLPSLMAALGLAGMIGWTGWKLLGRAGLTIALAVFGLNLLSPRLATLVRTDMILAFFCFLPGWLIYLKLQTGSSWTTGDRVLFGLGMAGALLTKGPVIYAFLLPGLMLAFFLLPDAVSRRLLWSGWLSWLIPLVIFVAWGIAGLLQNEGFYEDVVVREFLSRFQEGSRDDERPQPWWFYFPHLLHKLAPWSVLLLAAFALSPNLRAAIRKRPALLWCIVWVLGGLLVMTLIPAKRVDRIYPLIPPIALLALEVFAILKSLRSARIATGAGVIAAVLFSGGYFIGLVPLTISEGAGDLVRLTREVKTLIEPPPSAPLYIVRSRDEGILVYLDKLRFTSTSEFQKAWDSGNAAWFLISDRMVERNADRLAGSNPVLEQPVRRKNEAGYQLFWREATPRELSVGSKN